MEAGPAYAFNSADYNDCRKKRHYSADYGLTAVESLFSTAVYEPVILFV